MDGDQNTSGELASERRANRRRILLLAGLLLLLYVVLNGASEWRISNWFERPESAGDSGVYLDPIEGESRIVDIVERTNPAVVSITVTRDVPVVNRFYEEFQPFGPDGPTFRVPRVREEGTQEQEVGGGSGFIVSADGLVVTNRHVVDDEAASYTVFTPTGGEYDATVIARDPLLDIAILQIDGGGNLPYLSFGDSDALRLGQTAIAIGNALGEFQNSVSVGVISGLSRSIVAGDQMGSAEFLENVIQTDAAINPGNSGGPLLDSSGNVIGVNVAVAFGSENIGFALPGNAVRQIVESVEEHGEIVRPYIGVRYVSVTRELATAQNLPLSYGALVGGDGSAPGVVPGSPAAGAGIQNGDLIIEVGGMSLENRTLASVIAELSVGESVPVVVLRGNERLTLSVVLERLPNTIE